MLLTQGKSYIWIFCVFGLVWIVLIVGVAVIGLSIKLVAPLLPLFMLFMIVSQIRSELPWTVIGWLSTPQAVECIES